MFTKRLVSGIILVILAIIIVGKGGALLYGVTALISLIGLFAVSYTHLDVYKRQDLGRKFKIQEKTCRKKWN